MTAAGTELKLEVAKALPYAPERVFDAWLDPKMLAKFMMPGPDMSVPEAQTDPQVGGAFRIVMQTGDGTQIPHTGEYKAIKRPHQIVFTWNSPFSQDDSTVTLDFEAEGDGTLLRLTHVKLPSEESRANHEGGWKQILETLAGAL